MASAQFKASTHLLVVQDAVTKYISSKASGEAESEDAMADPEATQLLWSLLKVMCTHYGKLQPG